MSRPPAAPKPAVVACPDCALGTVVMEGDQVTVPCRECKDEWLAETMGKGPSTA